MGRRGAGLVFGVWVLVLFVAVFAVVLNVTVVGSSGTIYIRADGSIDPPTASITTVDNITYTFTDNINSDTDGIVVERSNIIIDGNGYTLQGTGSENGFYIGYNVTIRETNIKGFEYGIYVFYSSYNTILGNNITDNIHGIYLYASSYNGISGNNITGNDENGIWLMTSSYNSISGNEITKNNDHGIYLMYYWGECSNNTIFDNRMTNNNYGIYFSSSSSNSLLGNTITDNNYGVYVMGWEGFNNTLRSNNMVGNRYSFGVFDSFVQDVDASNMIDGKPIRYLFNQDNLIINVSTFPDIGYLALVNSYNITVEGLELKNNGQGMLLANTTNSKIINNNITNNTYGIYLDWWSCNNTIFHNNFINNTEQAWVDSEQANSWDLGYHYCGNYWSDYTGVDDYSGPSQNETGSDGIGDTPYDIMHYGGVVGQDGYPLMNPWPSEPELQVTLKAPTRLLHESSTLLEATVFNRGLSNETDVNVFLFVNDTIVNSTTISLLESGSSYSISYLWTPAIEGLFNVTAFAPPLSGETFFANNRATVFVNTRTPVHNIDTGLDYFTIQEAIDAPETLSGHTIQVEAGIYYESVMIQYKDSLTLEGEDPATTIIDGNSTGSDITIFAANNVYISNFTIRNGFFGISIIHSSNNVLRNNTIIDNHCNFYHEIREEPSEAIQDIDTSNTVDGKPIYYWIGQSNKSVPSDAGYVALVNSYNMTVEGLELKNNEPGILLAGTTDSHVINNNITAIRYGIWLYSGSSNNNVTGNRITKAGSIGVYISESSNNNIVSENDLRNNGDGIQLWESSCNNITGNNIANNTRCGVFVSGYTSGPPDYNVWYSCNNVISRNNVTDNGYTGVYLVLANDNTVSGNKITNNGGGVFVNGYWSGWPDYVQLYSVRNMISENNITSNGDGVDLLQASSNTISKNKIENCQWYGITLARSYSNTISENHITHNPEGIDIATYCSNNIVSNNNVTENSNKGILLHEAASSNIILGNNIANNGEEGIYSSGSPSGNKIYHNNLINNGENAWVYSGGYANTWDDGYPSGGNYWSNYTGSDVKSGPSQDQPGSDGIGDTSYTLTGGNIDNYPLMSPWPSGPGLHELEVNLNAPTYLSPGNSTLLEATVRNTGFVKEENVTLSLSINGNIVNSTTIPLLETGSSYTINYLWTPTTEGQANVTAYVTPVFGEILVENNRKTIFVTISVNPPVQNINTGLYYETIQEAIDAPETLDGHSIKVKAGIYYEHVTISKSLIIIGEDMISTIIDGSKTGTFVVQITANNVVLSGFTVQNSNTAPTPAIVLYSSNNVIDNNTIINNGWGIYAFSVSNNTIENNIITNNVYGVYLEWVTTHTVKNNTISDHQQAGIYLRESRNNIFTNNIIENNKDGIVLISDSNYNEFYHNSFIDNTSQGFAVNSDTNTWDNGYPSGGNYWSNYAGVDVKSGPNQDQPGSDGVGDTFFTFSGTNQDRYPLMNPMGSPQSPIALFTYAPENPVKDQTVTFDASASGDRDGFITTYKWDFGDGNITTTTDPIITHVYTASGTYNINLTITDNDGLIHSATKSVTVTEDSTPPTTVHDYDDLWHTSDFTITLTATDDSSGVAETYYRINNGPIQNVTANGQPLITTEGANNKLEYWSVDNADNEELPHKILTGIKLDESYPTVETPSRTPDGNVLPDQSVKVSVNITDSTSGVKNVTLYFTINDGETWTELPMNHTASNLYEATIPPQEVGTTVRFKIVAYDHAGNNRTLDGAEPYCVYQVVPEFPTSLILPLFIIITLLAAIAYKRKHLPL